MSHCESAPWICENFRFRNLSAALLKNAGFLIVASTIPAFVEYPPERNEKRALQGVGIQRPEVSMLVVFLENLRVVAGDVVYLPVAAVALDRRFDVAANGVKHVPVFSFGQCRLRFGHGLILTRVGCGTLLLP